MELYTKKQLLAALPVYIGFILLGYGTIWSGNISVKLTMPDETPLPEVITLEAVGTIVQLFWIGIAVGPYITRYLSDSKGRKLSFFLGGCLIFFSFLVLMLVNNMSMIFAGLSFMGLGTGIVYIGGVVYLGEIASTNIRGTILALSGFFVTIGMVTAFVLFILSTYFVTCCIGMLLSGVYLLAMYYVPESPVFYTMNGTEENIQTSLKTLGRESELDKMLANKQELKATKTSAWSQLFSLKGNKRAILITIILVMLQQVGGLVSTEFYTTTIFVFIDRDSPVRYEVITSLNAVTKIVANLVAAFLVDKVGRRSLLMISTSSCALSLAILGTYFFIDFLNGPNRIGSFWIPVLVITNYFLSFELGFSIIPQTLIGELFTTKARITGATFVLSTAILFGRGFAVFHRHVLIHSFGVFVQFWIFSVVCGVAFIFTIYLVPETNGKSLGEIEKMVGKKELVSR